MGAKRRSPQPPAFPRAFDSKQSLRSYLLMFTPKSAPLSMGKKSWYRSNGHLSTNVPIRRKCLYQKHLPGSDLQRSEDLRMGGDRRVRPACSFHRRRNTDSFRLRSGVNEPWLPMELRRKSECHP